MTWEEMPDWIEEELDRFDSRNIYFPPDSRPIFDALLEEEALHREEVDWTVQAVYWEGRSPHLSEMHRYWLSTRLHWLSGWVLPMAFGPIRKDEVKPLEEWMMSLLVSTWRHTGVQWLKQWLRAEELACERESAMKEQTSDAFLRSIRKRRSDDLGQGGQS